MDHYYKSVLENKIKGKIIDIKTGASGAVYIVDNGKNVFPQKIAFKSIRVDKLDETKKKYFLDECYLWITKSSNYIVKALYPIIIDDLPFICMPYFELDLNSFMLENDLKEIEAIIIAAQISKALIEMQKNGIRYHQDFNPPNILLDNLTKNFPGYPTDNHINYSIKIADFGIANLIERIGPTQGGGGGKFPFKAPEQYYPKKYNSYNPDIFALGVIIYMLLTNKHPNGLEKKKALNRHTSSSYFDKWAFKAKVELTNKTLQNIVNKTLQENPLSRPTAKEVYNILMSELQTINKSAHSNLKFKLGYLDAISPLDSSQEIDKLRKLSTFPDFRDNIKNTVSNVLQNSFSQITTEIDVIKIGDYYTLSTDLLPESLIDNSKKLIEILSVWYSKIKVIHKYPQIMFEGKTILKLPDIRDIEVVSSYIVIIYKVLSKHKDSNDIDKLFKQYNDDIFYSIYLYSKASIVRASDIYECISLLNKSKDLFKNEPLFDYMKYLWITHYLLVNEDDNLEKIKDETYTYLKKEYSYWKTINNL